MKGECHIHGSYSPCMFEYWFCETSENVNGETIKDDCTQDFLGIDFWTKMRQEEFWTRP
jgi:hypothetical protein